MAHLSENYKSLRISIHDAMVQERVTGDGNSAYPHRFQTSVRPVSDQSPAGLRGATEVHVVLTLCLTKKFRTAVSESGPIMLVEDGLVVHGVSKKKIRFPPEVIRQMKELKLFPADGASASGDAEQGSFVEEMQTLVFHGFERLKQGFEEGVASQEAQEDIVGAAFGAESGLAQEVENQQKAFDARGFDKLRKRMEQAQDALKVLRTEAAFQKEGKQVFQVHPVVLCV